MPKNLAGVVVARVPRTSGLEHPSIRYPHEMEEHLRGLGYLE